MWEGTRTMFHLRQSSRILLDRSQRCGEAREPCFFRQASAVVLSERTFKVLPAIRGRNCRRESLIVSSSFQFMEWFATDWDQTPSVLCGSMIPHQPHSEASVIITSSGQLTCMGTGVRRRSGFSQGCKVLNSFRSTGTGMSLVLARVWIFIHFRNGRR